MIKYNPTLHQLHCLHLSFFYCFAIVTCILHRKGIAITIFGRVILYPKILSLYSVFISAGNKHGSRNEQAYHLQCYHQCYYWVETT